MSGHAPWRRIRDAHLQTPEARQRYADAKAKLDALLAAYEAGDAWQCPHCGDWFLPDDELGRPPVCDMCKLGRSIAEESES